MNFVCRCRWSLTVFTLNIVSGRFGNYKYCHAVNVFFFLKVCYARVLDYRRKFIEAAQRYNELSYKSIVHETERLEALKHALHCTILASAGETSPDIFRT